jgi:hypothetical protein
MAQPFRPPSQATGRVGDVLRFEATAEGDKPFKYQWRKDGGPLAGQTGAVLTLPLYQQSDTGAYDVVVSNTLGSASAEAVTLTVTPLTPTPATTSAAVGGTARFAVAITSTPDKPVTVQWRRNGVTVTGATAATLDIADVTERDFGSYTALVTSAAGQFASAPAALSQDGEVAAAPAITIQPLDVTLRSGTDTAFSSTPLALSIAATGTPAPRYQWKRDGVDLVGATSSTLLIESARRGAYSVVVSNASGTVVSRNAAVELNRGNGWMRNLASQGKIGAQGGDQTLGFYLLGSASKQLLVRAVGPTLGLFGLPEVLDDPALELFNAGGQSIGVNDNWGTVAAEAAGIRTAGASVGAFPLTEGSADAALVVRVSPGAHTIRTVGIGNSTGTTLTELYDLEDAITSGSRLVNLSRRDSISRPGEILVSGFVVDGNAAKTFLIRAIGPTLRLLGVPNAVAEPQLKIFDGANRLVASNVAWESAGVSQAVVAYSASAGAFALPRGTADSCVLATLPPGSYTAHVTAGASETGEVIFEVYEVQ